MDKTNEACYQMIDEIEDYAIIFLDREGNIVGCNKGAEKIRGYETAEIVGKHFGLFCQQIDSSGEQLAQKLITEAITNGKSTHEGWRTKKDGTTFWGSVMIKAIQDDQGSLTGFVTITHDLTHKKEIEKSLLEFNTALEEKVKERTEELYNSEKKYRSLFENNPIPMWIIDPVTFQFLDVNEIAINHYGYTREEFLSMSAMDIRPEEDRELFLEVRNIITVNNYRRGVGRHIKKDGTILFAEVTAHNVHFDDKVVRLIFATDVTDQKNAETALINSELRYRSLIEQASDGIFIFDENGNFIDVNTSACLLVGYSKEELLQLNRTDLMQQEKHISNSPSNIEELKNGKPILFERILHRKDGSCFPVEINSKLLPDGRFLGIVRDITARKKAEEKIIKTNRLYAFSSQINQSIVKMRDEQALFEEVCRIALNIGKFKMAMIGQIDQESQTVYLLKECGMSPEDGALFITVPYNENGPTKQVLNNNTYYVSNDVANNSELIGWQSYAAKRGIRSYIELPLRKSGHIFATLNLFATEKFFFDQEEVLLLEEITNDISFALDYFENEHQRKITEEKLAHNESKLKEAQAIAHIGNWELDVATGMSVWSEETCKIHGLPPDQNLQSFHSWLSFLHPDDLSSVLQSIKHARNNLTDATFHHRIVLPDGTIKYIYSQTKFEYNESRQEVRVLGVMHDVTERKRAEESLLQSEANLRIIMDLVPYCIFAKDQDGKYLFANKTFANLYGYTSDAIVNKYMQDLAPIEQQIGHDLAEDREVILSGSSHIIPETTIIDASGASRTFYTIKVPYTPAGSEEQAVLVVAVDVTEMKKTENSLKESSYFLEKAQEVAHIGHWVFDFITNKAVWSAETCAIYGIEPINKPFDPERFYTLAHPDDRSLIELKGLEAVEQGKHFEVEHRIVRPDKTIRWVHELGEIFYNEDNKAVQMLGIVRDVTEEKHRETEKMKIINDLMRHNKDLEQFAYIVSHNLRAPLANIMGIASLMKMDPTTTSREATILMDQLSTSVKRLDDVIKDLNNVLQIKFQVNERKKEVRLSTLVNDIKLSIQHLLSSEHVTLETDFSETDVIITLKSYLHSIFYNLISNSIKYHQPGIAPMIRIRSVVTAEHVELIFTDNGLGIDLNKKGDQVFGLYKRFHAHKEGKGMGLYMVKTQVETLGGSIAIQSAVNKGTTFIIHLPITEL